MADSTLSRRQFVAGAATLGLGVTIVPRHVLGGRGYTAPSDQLNVAIIGSGGMGIENAMALVKGGQRLVAIADVDFDNVARALAKKIDEERNPERKQHYLGVKEQYGRAKRHADFRRLIEQEKGIDAVVIASPDHVHAHAAKMAMEAGKHVYVQKPLTYSVHEARVLRETAQRTGVVTQMGNQGHSNPEAQLINQWLRGGAIGPVREIHAWTDRPIWPQGVPLPERPAPESGPPRKPPFGNPFTSRSLSADLATAMASGASAPPAGLDWDLFVGPAQPVRYHPVYHPFNWRGWVNFGVGALGDMGAHLIDHPYWALGLTYPTSVEATSTPWGGDADDPASYPQSMLVHYDFPARGEQPPVRMTWYDGGLMPTRPAMLPDTVQLSRMGGVIVVGDKGVLVHETYGLKPRIYPDSLFREVAGAYVAQAAQEERDEFARRLEREAASARGSTTGAASTGAAASIAARVDGNGGASSVAATATPSQLRPGERPYGAHEMNWVDAIRNHTKAICPFEYAGPLTETMLLGIVALRAGQGKKIYYDADAMRVVNVPDADRFLRREYRAGWSL